MVVRGAGIAIGVAALLGACVPSGPNESEEPEIVTAGEVSPLSPGASAAAPDRASAPTTSNARPDAQPSADGTGEPAPEPSPFALACPTYDDGLDWSSVAIEGHRFGPVCVGMTFEEAGDRVPGHAIAGRTECPWVAPVTGDGPLEIVAVTSPVEPDGPIRFFRLVYRGDLATASPHDLPSTREGVAPGSPRADVADAYPTAKEITQDDPARGVRQQVVAEQPGSHHYVFDIVDGVVAELTWGTGLSSGIAGELCAL